MSQTERRDAIEPVKGHGHRSVHPLDDPHPARTRRLHGFGPAHWSGGRTPEGDRVVSRWALFVDAGWLFAAGSVSAIGERLPRREIQWDPRSLVEALVAQAAGLVPSSTELLRTYWYDGSPNRLPQGDQRELAALPDVKLRLGRTAPDGQKGVDGLIIHDLITHAYRRTIDDAVVISGDEDLLDAIESAQAHGTRVHLLEIPIGGIADALLRAVDRRGQL